jgi:endonuclease/exonuclease/phosphatase family metal-dependent hydrolase
MSLRHLRAAVFLLLVPAIGAGQQQPGRATGAIVAWNFAGFNAIPAARQARIARSLLDLDAEVVAAVEVNPDEAIHDVAAALTELGACYDAVILDQTATQNIGVLFKCGVLVANPRLVPDSDDGSPGLRKALAVDVRIGDFDFLLITVHLKAGRTAGDRQIRTRQAGHIAAFIAAGTAGDEKDVLVVGDYNMIPGPDSANFSALNPAGRLRFVSSEDLTGQFSHLSEGSGCDDGNLLDGFAVAAGHTTEYLEASLRIYPMNRPPGLSVCAFRDSVSDHLPLIARFRILADDDSAAAAPGAGVRIVSLLPNPSGSDNFAEQVTLQNPGGTEVSFAGWRIMDEQGNEFVLSGTIAAGATRTITLERTAMLNNGGDEVRLVAPAGLVHTMRYSGPVPSGQAVTPAPP